MQALCKFSGGILDKETGKLLEYKHLVNNPKYKEAWRQSFGNEIGWLAQGMPNRVEGTDIAFFIHKNQIPTNRLNDIAYEWIVCDYWEGKAEPNCTRLTVSSDRIKYQGDCGIPTSDLLTVKIMFNSIIFHTSGKIMDVKNFYLKTPMKRFEYLWLLVSNIPDNIKQHYKLQEKDTNDGFIYVDIWKGMYRLTQAG